MDQENNIDELDKMLFEYFDNSKEVPNYINETIHNTLQKEKKKRNSINIIKKVAIIIISFGIISTSAVFADDIINFITSLFTNSTEAIDSAVENGYVQNVDMDYIYDKDIGVKVDNVVLDDTNLDISFVYNYRGIEEINSIELYEYTIKDEDDKILYEFSEEPIIKDSQDIITEVMKDNKMIQIDNNTYKESLIYSAEKINNINKLIIEIKRVNLISNNENIIIIGNWKLEIELNDLFKSRDNEYYNISENDYVNDSLITLTETSLKIYLELNCDINTSIIRNNNQIVLKDDLGKEYLYDFSDLKTEMLDGKNINKLYLEYDIGKYFYDINNLELIIKNESEDIVIKLNK